MKPIIGACSGVTPPSTRLSAEGFTKGGGWEDPLFVLPNNEHVVGANGLLQRLAPMS